MAKHAYLILAHAEPELLRTLVALLDDPRNDIYIHFDAKVKQLPELQTQAAGLTILSDRVSISWADVSMLEAEYKLFKAARGSGKSYSYYHLLSGVDLPIKSQDYIHSFFDEQQGKEFVGIYQKYDSTLDRRVRYRHLFPKHFRKEERMSGLFRRILRYAWLELQSRLKIQRSKDVTFYKGAQWVSITERFLDYVLEHEAETLKRYQATFAPDEFFIQTLIVNSPFKEQLYDATDETRGCMRYIGWTEEGDLPEFTREQLPELQQTECLFARKFNSKDPAFITEVSKLARP